MSTVPTPTPVLAAPGEARVYAVTLAPPGAELGYITLYAVVGSRAVALIDSGPASTAAEAAEALSPLLSPRRPVYIALTHIHLDHGGGAARLARLLGCRGVEARVLVHPRGLRHLVDPSRLWEAARSVLGERALEYGEPEPLDPALGEATSDGEALDLGGAALRVLHTPGHASHHQSFVLEGAGLVFTGDSAGVYDPVSGGLAPTTPPPFKPEAYLASLERMMEEGPRLVAPTHIGLGPGWLLERHREQVELWLEKLRGAEGEPRELLRRVLDADPLARRLYDALGWLRHIEGMLLDSVEGVARPA